MKDKITISLIFIFFIGMYWISRTSNIASSDESFISEESVPTQLEDTTMDFIDYDSLI